MAGARNHAAGAAIAVDDRQADEGQPGVVVDRKHPVAAARVEGDLPTAVDDGVPRNGVRLMDEDCRAAVAVECHAARNPESGRKVYPEFRLVIGSAKRDNRFQRRLPLQQEECDNQQSNRAHHDLRWAGPVVVIA